MNEPLEKLAELVGITDGLDVYETPDEWKYYRVIDTSRLAAAAKFAAFEALLPELRKHYGDALSLRFKSKGDWTEFEMSAAKLNEPLVDLRAAVDERASLTLDITIDKAAVAAQRNLTDRSVVTRLFLYEEALAHVLSSPLMDLDGQLFSNVPPGRKLIILIDSHDIFLDGPWLAIVGGKFVPQWRDTIGDPHGEPLMLALRQRKVIWNDFVLHRLTPLHLILRVNSAAVDDRILAALHGPLFVCSVLFLARRSTWDIATRTWTSTFAADRQETDVLLAPPSTPRKPEWDAACAMAEMARWAYETDRADDRLTVVQQTVVDALQNNNAETNGTEIFRLAADLFLRASRGWEAFIRGELKKYIEQVKALEETVAVTAKDYNEQVGTLAATVIANMLAAVGVVLGSFLVAVFKSPFDENIFQFGTAVYVIYLIAFPIAVGLLATRQRFNRSAETFAARKASFKQRIPEKEVDEITVSILGKSESWFRNWFAGCIIAYGVVVIVLIAAILKLPPKIRSWNGNPDDFTLKSVAVNQPVPGAVTIRGESFDRRKDIVVILGHAIFTNAVDPPTLKVYGATALIFTPRPSELSAKLLTVRQGGTEPKQIAMR